MPPALLRHARVVSAALVVVVLLLAACTRKDAPGASSDDTSGTTELTGTSIAPTSEPPSTAPGDPGSTTTTEEETDAFGHTAAEVAAFVAAYSQAFRAECQRIFDSLGGGPLSDPDFPEDQYLVDDCIFELDETWGELVDSVEEATTTGIDDAQIAASDLADPLCDASGTTCWSYGD